jgi:hypothetical protein
VEQGKILLSQVSSKVLGQAKVVLQETSAERREDRLKGLSGTVSGAETYAGLDPSSLALVGIHGSGRVAPALNLVIPRFRADAVFAGTKTAIEVAVGMAERLGWSLRIIVTNSRFTAAHRKDAASYLVREFGLRPDRVDLWTPEDMFEQEVSRADLWLVTHWSTAHAADVAARIGLLDRDQVVYLVQDYEPGFTPWSTQHALASSTYHAGFHFIVNSSPLASYLLQNEALHIPAEQVFRPNLSLDRLSDVASKRVKSPVVRIMFYGRPSKPRNLFSLGISSLRVAARRFEVEGIAVSMLSAGEAHPDYALSSSNTLASKGTLGWEGYYDRLAQVDVMLSLQYSPHPSHPPLDAVVSGARAVTNEFGGERNSLSHRLSAGAPDPDSLGELLVEASLSALSEDTSPPELSVIERLGAPLNDVTENVLGKIRGANSA